MKLFTVLCALVLALTACEATSEEPPSDISQVDVRSKVVHQCDDTTCIAIQYICDYDVLCDLHGKPVPGPPNTVIILGNGRHCTNESCRYPWG